MTTATTTMSTATTTIWNAKNFGRSLPTPHPNSTYVNQIRQRVLLETLDAFEKASATREFHKAAETNLERWHKEAISNGMKTEKQSSSDNNNDDHERKSCEVIVLPGDWGVVTAHLTREYGTIFAVLNMANSFWPGGGYTEGCLAQEENMFRRTDCHFSIPRDDTESVKLTDPANKANSDIMYTEAMTRLLCGREGRVYLDTTHPRVCIRGPEDRNDEVHLGYKFFPLDEVFPFYELRAAAVDLRRKEFFSEYEMRRRIAAQLDTLIASGIRHAILSAFGCGAFLNPAKEVARIYREEVERRRMEFHVVAFAVFHAGYGPNNFTFFEEAFKDFKTFANNAAVGSDGEIDAISKLERDL